MLRPVSHHIGAATKLRRFSDDGETRTRTGDTTIFSRVLYQLSYLAGRLMLADAELRHQRGVGPAQPLGDRDLGPPAELTLGAGDVQAAVLQLTRT